MNLYSIALFVHILGAVLVFVLLATEGLGLRYGFAYGRVNQAVGPAAALAIFVPGIYMMATQWGWAGWTVTGIVTYVLIASGSAYTAAAVMRGRMNRGTEIVSLMVRIGMAVAVAFDMTVKPSLLVSVLAVIVGIALGAGVAAVTRRQPVAA
jgi:hypothetical protein